MSTAHARRTLQSRNTLLISILGLENPSRLRKDRAISIPSLGRALPAFGAKKTETILSLCRWFTFQLSG